MRCLYSILMTLMMMGAVSALRSVAASPFPVEVVPGVLLVGQFPTNEINESSGVIQSRRGAGAFWTHNDGDNSIFSFNRLGRQLGKWNINSVPLLDFEDIAWSPGRIYIGDIGNNDLTNRTNIVVYSVPEPGPTFSGTLPLKGRWRLRYPNDQPFDAESLLIHRRNGYVIEKQLGVDGAAGVHRFSLRGNGIRVLEPTCRLNTDSDIGGADLTRDGNRLAVITDEGPYLFALPGTIPETGTLQPALYVPFLFPGMEACCFTRDGLLVTAETGEIFLFTHPELRMQPPPR
jgi:hypothetical protein